MTRTRRTKFGYPFNRLDHTTRLQGPSSVTFVGFKPVGGWSHLPDVDAGPGSIISGQNCWIRNGRLQPRWRLATLASNNIFNDVPNGSFIYNDVDGTEYPVITSKGTVAYLDGSSMNSLTYASGVSDLEPSGGRNDNFFGTSVYLERRDLNIAVFTNGIEPLFAWGGPSDNTAFSTLTESPAARDVTLFDNSPIAWNIKLISSNTRFVNRVQWATGTDPEDWTGIGSGFEDLVDMHGEGTRIFTAEGEMVLATDQELWIGRRRGDAFRFQFQPLSRELGMPYPLAAIQTPYGIFWLNDDYMVYNLAGRQLNRPGQPILEQLRNTLGSFTNAHFGYNPQLQQLTLYYAAKGDVEPRCSFTLHLAEPGTPWTPHKNIHELTVALEVAQSSAGTIWDDLVGTIDAQSATYDDILGLSGAATEGVVSSLGTVYDYDSKVSLDDTSQVLCQAQTGALFAGDPVTYKFVQDVRLDARADSASSLSVKVSGSLGGAYGANQEVAVSVGSQTSQTHIPVTVNGQYHALAFESNDTGWEISRVFVKARAAGEVF